MSIFGQEFMIKQQTHDKLNVNVENLLFLYSFQVDVEVKIFIFKSEEFWLCQEKPSVLKMPE